MRERKYLTDNNKVNIMVVKGKAKNFFDIIPELDEESKKKFADFALESAEMSAKSYPPQMKDLIISWSVGEFISHTVAVMVMDILYSNGTFKPLCENEKITSNLIMFADRLPNS